MSLFQLAGLGLSLTICGLFAWGVARGRSRPRTALPWTVLWAAAAVAFAWPESTAIVARRLGVDRGADLISYVSVLAMLAGFFWVSVRLRNLNREITLLVRQLALSNAQHALDAGRDTPGAVWSEE